MLAVIVLVAVICFTVARTMGVLGKPAALPTYKVGDTLTWLPTKGSNITVRTTVIVFGQSNCSACQASIPLLNQIHDAVVQYDRPFGAREHTTRMILLDVAGNGKAELEFAGKFGLGSEHVADYRKPDPKLRSVPMFLVLDENSKILFVSEGVTPETVEVIKALLARP
jgi:hypothetical protein